MVVKVYCILCVCDRYVINLGLPMPKKQKQKIIKTDIKQDKGFFFELFF